MVAFRWVNLTEGYYAGKMVSYAFWQTEKKFKFVQLVSSCSLSMSINSMFNLLVPRSSWAQKAFTTSINGVGVLQCAIVIVMWGEWIDPNSYEGEKKRCVQFWRYSSQALAVMHVALVALTAKQSKEKTLAYMTTVVMVTLAHWKTLPIPIEYAWSYTSYAAIAFSLYDGSSAQRIMGCLTFTQMMFPKSAQLPK